MVDRSELMNAARISRGEITYPDNVSKKLLLVMAKIRESIGEPIVYNSSGEGAFDTGHSRLSLHKYNIDHSESKKTGVKKVVFGAPYKAFDVSCPTIDIRDFYYDVERLVPGGGVGIYPFWNRPGLHIDVRSIDHPTYGVRWVRNAYGEYLIINNFDELKNVLKVASRYQTGGEA